MYVFDTNIVLELRKAKTNRADPTVVNWCRQIPAEVSYISATRATPFFRPVEASPGPIR